MRIILASNSINSCTGYGQQSKFLIKAFRDLGHEVICTPHYGVQGGYIVMDDVINIPAYRDVWQQDMMKDHVKSLKADLVMNFHDCWVLSPDYPKTFDAPWIAYSPVDSVPANPLLVRVLQRARYPMTMSKFGRDELQRSGINASYIPHAVAIDIFKPGDKLEARKKLGLFDVGLKEDDFLCLMVAANQGYPSRKAFPEQLSAFAQFRKSHPDAKLFLHTAMRPTNHMGGLDIHSLVASLDLKGSVFNTPEYDMAIGVDQERLATLYQAADVTMNASYAGGFEIVLIESQACGTPVISHAFSSMTELTHYGRAVPSIQKFWHPHNTWQAIPSIPAITQALSSIYADRDIDRSEESYNYIKENYSYDVVRDIYWSPFLEQVQHDIEQGMSVAAD